MKKNYISLFVLMQVSVFGQTITFTDPNFKALLLSSSPSNEIAIDINGNRMAIDANNNGEIELSEASNVYQLVLKESTIQSIAEISNFSHLTSLRISHINGLQTIDASALHDLKSLAINYTSATINTTGCNQLNYFELSYYDGPYQNLTFLQNPSLTMLNIGYNTPNIVDLNLAQFPLLESLYMTHSSDTAGSSYSSLDLSANPQLKNILLIIPNLLTLNTLQNPNVEYVYLNTPSLHTITMPNNNLVNYFRASNSNLSELDFSQSPLLSQLYLYENNALNRLNLSSNNNLYDLELFTSPLLTEIDLTQKPRLFNANILRTRINSLDFSGSRAIQQLILHSEELSELDLSLLNNLEAINIYADNLTQLDFSSNPNLGSVSLNGNQIRSINFKNGSGYQDYYRIFERSLPSLRYVCIDEDKLVTFRNNLPPNTFQNLEINTYCSFRDGGTPYNIQGQVYLDLNGNGLDSNDPSFPYPVFQLQQEGDSGIYIGNQSGDYNIYTRLGQTTITPYLEQANYFSFQPGNFTTYYPSATNSRTQDFVLSANGVHPDLETFIIPINTALPGEEVNYTIVYKNKGTTTQSGNLSFSYDATTHRVIFTDVTPTTSTAGLMRWNFNDLAPFEQRNFYVKFLLNTPTQEPPLNSDDVLTYEAVIQGTADETPNDNTFTLSQIVTNSFDPNDKICLEGESISPEKVGEYVHYRIRFENTGTANAKNIVVKDDIDATKFEIGSLIPLSSSHYVITKIKDNRVEFIFENIQLPFDDENNDGYVVFKIKTKPNLQLNDTFSNTAQIYFDYNHPIITNTFTTAVRTLGIPVTSFTEDAISVYPNPVKNKLNFQSKENVLKAEIYDTSGRLVFVSPVHQNTVNVKDLPKGNYIIKAYLAKGITTQKMIKD